MSYCLGVEAALAFYHAIRVWSMWLRGGIVVGYLPPGAARCLLGY